MDNNSVNNTFVGNRKTNQHFQACREEFNKTALQIWE